MRIYEFMEGCQTTPKNSLRSFEDFALIWEFPMIDIILLVFYHFPQKLTHEPHCLPWWECCF